MSTNYFQQVATMQDIMLATLQNENCILNLCNKKFKDFPNTIVNNLGATVSIYQPVRVTGIESLTIATQGVNQFVQNLSITNPLSSSVEFTIAQMIENVDPFHFMEKVGNSMIAYMGSQIEQKVALDFIKYPYRFYDMTSNNTATGLAKALSVFRNYGSASQQAVAIIPDTSVPDVVNSMANQFTLRRNDDAVMSWQLGSFSMCDFNQSNQLQVHFSGDEGNEGVELTVVSTTKDTAGNITAITFSGCSSASNADSVKQYDRFYCTTPGVKMLQYQGYNISANDVQFVASADAASTSGSQVTVELETPLYPGFSTTQSVAINTDIVAGMTFKALPDFKAGVIYSGNPHMLAMPQMGDMSPWATAYKADPETGASIQLSWGSQFQTGSTDLAARCLYGSTLFPQYAMTLIYPAY